MHPPTTALLMIDIQNDFCPGGALAVDGGDEIIDLVNDMQKDFHICAMTQDWHPPDHSSFADNHGDAAPFSVITMDYGPQVLWPRHCVQGSAGATFHANLCTDRADIIVRKGFRPQIDSYSAFYENDHETPTGLEGYLRNRDVTDVVIVGLATDFCVRFSALDAAELGFGVNVVEAACRGIDLDGSLDQARRQMKDAGVVLS